MRDLILLSLSLLVKQLAHHSNNLPLIHTQKRGQIPALQAYSDSFLYTFDTVVVQLPLFVVDLAKSDVLPIERFVRHAQYFHPQINRRFTAKKVIVE